MKQTRPLQAPAVYVPPDGPPQGAGPSREIYDIMGQDNLFRLCADFYAKLEQSEIRPLFRDDMPTASRKLAAFLTGLLGGPPLYHEWYGPPQMRARHLPFAIDEHARQVWLGCFRDTLADAETRYGFPAEHLPGFLEFLDSFSAWMVNRK